MTYYGEVLLDSVTSTEEKPTHPQVASLQRLSPSGSHTALVDAVAAAYPLHADSTGRSTNSIEQLEQWDGQRATILVRQKSGMFSTPQLRAWQGTVLRREGKPCLLPKGHRRHGYDLTKWEILDAVPGHSAGSLTQLREQLDAVTALFPAPVRDLAPDSFDRLPQLTDPGQENPCTLAVLTTLTSPGGERVGGVLWLLSNRRPAWNDQGDALQGVLIVPPSTLTSEHGSIHVRRLPRATAVLPTAMPVPYEHAMDLTGRPDVHSYLRVLQALHPSPGASASMS